MHLHYIGERESINALLQNITDTQKISIQCHSLLASFGHSALLCLWLKPLRALVFIHFSAKQNLFLDSDVKRIWKWFMLCLRGVSTFFSPDAFLAFCKQKMLLAKVRDSFYLSIYNVHIKFMQFQIRVFLNFLWYSLSRVSFLFGMNRTHLNLKLFLINFLDKFF